MVNEILHTIIKQALSFVKYKAMAAVQYSDNEIVCSRLLYQRTIAEKLLKKVIKTPLDFSSFEFEIKTQEKQVLIIGLNELRKFYYENYNHDHFGAKEMIDKLTKSNFNSCIKEAPNDSVGFLGFILPTSGALFLTENELTC